MVTYRARPRFATTPCPPEAALGRRAIPMIFNLFRRTPTADSIASLYGMIVAQARDAGVLPGLWGAGYGQRAVRDGGAACRAGAATAGCRAGARAPVGQALFDHFCRDMDASLREMGVGDLAVPREMQRMGEAFYGRKAAYDAALAAFRRRPCSRPRLPATSSARSSGRAPRRDARLRPMCERRSATWRRRTARPWPAERCAFPDPDGAVATRDACRKTMMTAMRDHPAGRPWSVPVANRRGAGDRPAFRSRRRRADARGRRRARRAALAATAAPLVST